MITRALSLTFGQVAEAAGHKPGADGKINLPNTQECADALSLAALSLVPWEPGDAPIDLTLTGAGPIWAYAKICHAFHGRAARLVIASPAATICIWSHGVDPVHA